MQHFYIIVPAYNASQWIVRCLTVIENQNYSNYEVVVVDDCSEDDTWDKIQQFPFHKIRNEKHTGSVVGNMVKTLSLYKSKSQNVDMVIDGDDWLPDFEVLNYLNELYKDDIWFTYGQFEPISGKYHNFCQPIHNTNTYRKKEEWTMGQLRTWKHWLWEKVKDADLRNWDGKYFIASCDRAFSYPMIEMAGSEHIRLADRVIYIYNDENPLCGFRMFPDECQKRADYIISKKEYKRL